MEEYIKREDAINLLWLYADESCASVVSDFESLPAADVVEVRRGRWFFTEYEFFTCSVCGESYYNGAESTPQAESYLNSGHTYKYCPNCGARMDKEDEHE